MRDSQRRVDILVFAVRHEEIEFPVPGVGDEGRRDFFEGVLEAELLIPAEEIAGNGLPPLQLREDRLKRGSPPRIVVVKSHLTSLRLRDFYEPSPAAATPSRLTG